MTKKSTKLSNTIVWIIFSTAFFCIRVVDVVGGESTPQLKSSPNQKRSVMMCGPNCMYIMLKLYGISVEPEIIEQYIPSNPKGMSIAELRDACAAHGLPLEPRKCSISEMRKAFQSPFIAHTYYPGGGHFTVVLAKEGDSFWLMDGLAGEIRKASPRWLANVWRGYVLIPTSRSRFSAFVLGFSMILWLVTAWTILRTTIKIRQATKNSLITNVGATGCKEME